MRQRLAFVLVLTLALVSVFGVNVLATNEPAAARTSSSSPTPEFTMLRVPYEEGIGQGWLETHVLRARYADDGTPIPFSLYYDGAVYATVPTYNAGREIEVFSSKEMAFADYDAMYYEFSTMMELSRVGIIRGNDRGEARPFENISRAEAVTMLSPAGQECVITAGYGALPLK